MAHLVRDQILDEARTRHDGGAEEAREVRVHVRALAPAFVRGDQPQPDLVFEHMRRRIDLDMQGPPQGDPHGSAVWRGELLIAHAVLAHFDGNWAAPCPVPMSCCSATFRCCFRNSFSNIAFTAS